MMESQNRKNYGKAKNNISARPIVEGIGQSKWKALNVDLMEIIELENELRSLQLWSESFPQSLNDEQKFDRKVHIPARRSFPPKLMKLLFMVHGNDLCVDCNTLSPTELNSDDDTEIWANIRFGSLICNNCAFRHCAFGREVSILSIKSSVWTLPDVLCMLEGGNARLIRELDNKKIVRDLSANQKGMRETFSQMKFQSMRSLSLIKHQSEKNNNDDEAFSIQYESKLAKNYILLLAKRAAQACHQYSKFRLTHQEILEQRENRGNIGHFQSLLPNMPKSIQSGDSSSYPTSRQKSQSLHTFELSNKQGDDKRNLSESSDGKERSDFSLEPNRDNGNNKPRKRNSTIYHIATSEDSDNDSLELGSNYLVDNNHVTLKHFWNKIQQSRMISNLNRNTDPKKKSDSNGKTKDRIPIPKKKSHQEILDRKHYFSKQSQSPKSDNNNNDNSPYHSKDDTKDKRYNSSEKNVYQRTSSQSNQTNEKNTETSKVGSISVIETKAGRCKQRVERHLIRTLDSNNSGYSHQRGLDPEGIEVYHKKEYGRGEFNGKDLTKNNKIVTKEVRFAAPVIIPTTSLVPSSRYEKNHNHQLVVSNKKSSISTKHDHGTKLFKSSTRVIRRGLDPPCMEDENDDVTSCKLQIVKRLGTDKIIRQRGIDPPD